MEDLYDQRINHVVESVMYERLKIRAPHLEGFVHYACLRKYGFMKMLIMVHNNPKKLIII